MIKVDAQSNAAMMLQQRSIMLMIKKQAFYILDGNVWMIDGETDEVYRAENDESVYLREMITTIQELRATKLTRDDVKDAVRLVLTEISPNLFPEDKSESQAYEIGCQVADKLDLEGFPPRN
jgi:hypothetical protein